MFTILHLCVASQSRWETTDWRAVCGRTARTVRRAGTAKAVPDPYRLKHSGLGYCLSDLKLQFRCRLEGGRGWLIMIVVHGRAVANLDCGRLFYRQRNFFRLSVSR